MGRLARFIRFYTDEDDGNGGGKGVLKTVTGALLHIVDALAKPINKFTATLEPIQDLHGQDSPYPAGGGKNKFNIDSMVNATGITISNGVITVTGNTRNSGKKLSELANLIVGETYTLTATTDGMTPQIYLYGTGANVSWFFNDNLTITQAHMDALVFFYGGKDGGVDLTSHITNFMIRPSSVTDATFAPYSNNCPITGHTGASVWDDPKYGGTIKWNQLLSEDQAIGSYSKFDLTFEMISGKMGFKVTGTFNYESGDRNAYIYRQNYPIAIIKDHVYCITYNSEYAAVYCYGAQFTGNWTGNAPHGGSIIKATNSANLNLSLNFGANISNGTVFNEEILINLFDLTEMFGEEKANEIYDLDMQTPRGQGVTWFRSLFPDNYYEQDDSYAETCVSAVNGDPYRHIPITFPDAAGTVYGCTLDVVSGKLVVDKADKLITQIIEGGKMAYRSGYARAYLGKQLEYPAPTGTITNFLCDTIQPKNIYSVSDNGIYIYSQQYMALGVSFDLINGYSDVGDNSNYMNAINQFLSDNNIHIVYELATPIEYTLTESQALSLLKGENNIWCDSSDSLELQYYAKAEETP